MNTEEITIRSIQHHLYCPHRWGLLEIDRAWAENMFVTKANLMHERVHEPEQYYGAKGKKAYTSVPVYCDQEAYNLYGITDCIELIPDQEGVPVDKSGKRYRLHIVEYKPTMPKGQLYREDDLMQIFAQKICVDFVFGGDSEGYIYYADVRKRIRLPLQENYDLYDEKLKTLLQEMRDCLKKGFIPEIRKGQNCNGCSMKDLCMPALKPIKNLYDRIRKLEEMD